MRSSRSSSTGVSENSFAGALSSGAVLPSAPRKWPAPWGFASVDDLFAQTDRLTSAIAAGAMSRLDWMRVLLATEVVFASDVLGSGIDWEATSGLSDEDSIAILRRVQRKLAGLRQLVGNGFGTPRGG